MARAGKGDSRSGDIGHEVAGGGEKCGARLPEDAAQRAIDLREQRAGIGGRLAALLAQRAHHRRHERRAHAVAHHVADEDADSGV